MITMDVEMPRMNGLTALRHIMAENPCPVIMISSLTQEGAETTLKALELGALDFMPKPGSRSVEDMGKAEGDLPGKIKALARRKAYVRLLHRSSKSPARPAGRTPAQPPGTGQAPSTAARPRFTGHTVFDVVAIGVSTGGPPAVQKILTALPGDFRAPILIAQHMPASFTGPFAKRLDAQCSLSVKEAGASEVLRSGTAYICPGGKHLRLEKGKGGMLTAVVSEEPKEALYKPSASVLMESVGLVLGRRGLGVTLTGMGNDGLAGTMVLKEKGGWAIAQSETSCVVYGMPKAIVDAGLADEIVDLDKMAEAIMNHCAK